MAVVSIFNPTNFGAPNLNSAIAGATNMTLLKGANLSINGRTYADIFEIDFVFSGVKYQDLLSGSGIIVNAGNSITAGSITGLIENVWDGFNWTPNWMLQDTSVSAQSLFQAYQTSSDADDLSIIALALKGDDIISGSSNGPDTILGGDGTDIVFIGGTGGNSVDGGNGIDTTVFTGLLNEHAVVKSANGSLTVTSAISSSAKPDILTNMEQTSFSDYTLVFDLTSTQDALVYRLYQAAFARTPDNAGFRFWANVSDRTQMSAIAISDQFLAAPEFSQKYGNPDNNGFATSMYANVLGRPPDAAGLSFWVEQLNRGTPRDQLLVSFANSAENIQLIAPHVSNGYWTT